MTAPTIFGVNGVPAEGGGWTWTFGPWRLDAHGTLGAVWLKNGRRTQVVQIQHYSSESEAVDGIESWLRVLLAETCGALGLELVETTAAESCKTSCKAAAS